MLPLIILAGPTASGKSETAIALAERLGAEIVSADSMQVYKYFDIGTAKPSQEARQRVVHHLIDVLEPDQEFTAFEFKLRALDHIRTLTRQNKVPILVGGTGLYIKVLLEDFECAVQASPEIRERVRGEIRRRGAEAAHAELARIDAPSAGRILPTDPLRIERALSVYYETGRRLSDFHAGETRGPGEFDARFFLFEGDRKRLYANIDRRIDGMMRMGLLDEAKSLLDRGYGKDLKPFQSIGYAQMARHLEGALSLDQAVYEAKRETRRYAKRQITWFKKVPKTISLPMEDSPPRLAEKILSCLSSAACLLAFVVLALAHAGAAGAGPLTYEEGLKFFEKGDYAKAMNHFQVIRRSLPNTPEARRALYLIGQIQSATQENDSAAETFKTSLAEYPEIEDYIRFDLAKAYLNIQDNASALEQAALLLEKFPNTRLVPQAEMFRAGVLTKLERVEEAVNFLDRAVARISKEPRDPDFVPYLPDLNLTMASLLETVGKSKQAYAIYRELYIRHSAHPAAEKAFASMKRLSPEVSPPLSEEELSVRIQNLLADVQYGRVVEEIGQHKKQSGAALPPPRFCFNLASAYQGLRQRAQANEILLAFLKAYPQHQRVLEAKYLAGRNFWNLNQHESGIGYFQGVIDAGPKSEWAIKARFALGKLYEEIKQYPLAIKQYTFLENLAEDHEFKESAPWRIGWIYYKQGDYKRSFEQFKSNVERVPDGQITDHNMFWMAKSAEKIGNEDGARQTFADLRKNYPFTYYGLRAREKLPARNAGLKDDPAARAEGPASLEEDAPAPPKRDFSPEEKFHYARAREMAEMGFGENARLEIRQIEKTVRKNLSGVTWLAGLYNSARAYAESFRILDAFRNFKNKKAQKELPVQFWKSLYPIVYSDIIQMNSRNHKIDPFLVKGLIQQESMFEAKSLSRAGARGLMQLMPETGRRIALSYTGQKAFVADSLYDPETNIKLGVKYLSELTTKFGDNPAYILICYNAGPEILKRWLEQFRDLKDLDEFLESIPYQETRIYVRNVLRNYGVYKSLYPNGGGRGSQSDIF